MQSVIDKLSAVLRHVRLVQDNCILLGQRLIERGDVKFGVALIARGMLHDNSKFYGIELDYLSANVVDRDKLGLAIRNHNETNDHHPEYWGSIHDTPRLALAELICDWKARSSEFGTSLAEWMDGDAMQRFGYKKTDLVYAVLKEYADLLCDKPFKKS